MVAAKGEVAFSRAHVGVGGAIGLLVLPQDIPIGVEYFRVLIGVSIELAADSVESISQFNGIALLVLATAHRRP